MKVLLWFATWIGALLFAGQRYDSCRDEGVLIPGCNETLEFVAWGIVIVGFMMFCRELRKNVLVKRWIGD